MVDRLDAMSRAIAALGKSLHRETGRLGARTSAGSFAPSDTRGTRTPGTNISTLASRLATLRRDDPQRSRRALRLFIEAVLLDEFGDALILSAELDRLVERSLAAMESDEGLRELLSRATDELLPGG
jgi:hypothetical protein